LIPAEDRAKAERLLRAGTKCVDVARVCRVSYPWVLNLRYALGLWKSRMKSPARRPAESQVLTAVGAQPEGGEVVHLQPVPVRLSDRFLLKAAEALDKAKDRHLDADTWEFVAALPHACREVVELRRLLDIRAQEGR
jgi:hypothetical protein